VDLNTLSDEELDGKFDRLILRDQALTGPEYARMSEITVEIRERMCGNRPAPPSSLPIA
jgi:hypothetical protein